MRDGARPRVRERSVAKAARRGRGDVPPRPFVFLGLEESANLEDRYLSPLPPHFLTNINSTTEHDLLCLSGWHERPAGEGDRLYDSDLVVHGDIRATDEAVVHSHPTYKRDLTASKITGSTVHSGDCRHGYPTTFRYRHRINPDPKINQAARAARS